MVEIWKDILWNHRHSLNWKFPGIVYDWSLLWAINNTVVLNDTAIPIYNTVVLIDTAIPVNNTVVLIDIAIPINNTVVLIDTAIPIYK